MISTSKKGNKDLALNLSLFYNIPYIRRGKKSFERLVYLSWLRKEPLILVSKYKDKDILLIYSVNSPTSFRLKESYYIDSIKGDLNKVKELYSYSDDLCDPRLYLKNNSLYYNNKLIAKLILKRLYL